MEANEMVATSEAKVIRFRVNSATKANGERQPDVTVELTAQVKDVAEMQSLRDEVTKLEVETLKKFEEELVKAGYVIAKEKETKKA